MTLIKDHLRLLGVNPSKLRGQNFLKDEWVLNDIVGNAPYKYILEIGPGLGVLTKALLKRTQEKVYSVEVESRLYDELQITFNQEIAAGRLKLILNNFIFLDLAPIAEECGERLYIYGNIPYSISSEILFKLLADSKLLIGATLLVQKEFAERICSGPGKKTYGIPSVLTAIFAEATLRGEVSGDSFHPKTKVSSSILELKFRDEPLLNPEEYSQFKKFVKSAFSSRRRTLVNNLKGITDNESLADVYRNLQIGDDARAEQLSPQVLIDLWRNLYLR